MLSIVARGASDELAALVRQLGAREVEIQPLSLEEIVVACLRGKKVAGEVEHV